MNSNHLAVRLLFCSFFSLAFMLVPWELFVGEFWDRAVYFEMFTTGNVVTEYESFDSALKFFVHEWLWNYSLLWWVEIGGDLNFAFFVIGLFFVFLCSCFLTVRCGFLYVVFLLNPLFVDLVFSQVRTAAAFSLLIVAYFCRQNLIALVLLCVAAAMVHTAAFVFLSFYVFVSLGRGGRPLGRLGLLFFALCCAFVLGPGREYFLSLIQDRRAVYEDMSSGLLFMLFWWFLLFCFTVYYKNISGEVLSRYGYFLMAVSCFNSLFLTYSTRFLAVAIPFLAYAISRLPVDMRLFLLFLGIFYSVFQWVYWLGFGSALAL